MKTLRILILVLALSATTLSCKKDDDFLRITAFETQLAIAVSAYRVDAGLNDLAHNYDILSKEAKANAEGRASGAITDDKVYDDMLVRWHTVEDKLGVTNVSNESYLSAVINDPVNDANASLVATQLVEQWGSDSIGDVILKGDYTIQGPGEGKTSDGRTYVMLMLCKFTQ